MAMIEIRHKDTDAVILRLNDPREAGAPTVADTGEESPAAAHLNDMNLRGAHLEEANLAERDVPARVHRFV